MWSGGRGEIRLDLLRFVAVCSGGQVAFGRGSVGLAVPFRLGLTGFGWARCGRFRCGGRGVTRSVMATRVKAVGLRREEVGHVKLRQVKVWRSWSDSVR
jgi:hypothetical protein